MGGNFSDTADGFQNVGERVRVTEPQIAVAVFAEGRAPEACDSGFVQKKISELLGGHSSPGDIGERVKRPGRHGAAESLNFIQAFDHRVASTPELRNHGANAVLHHVRSRSGDVLEGEITLVLDTEEVHLSAGDTVVQRGTNHAWSNRSNRPCVVAISSHDAAG